MEEYKIANLWVFFINLSIWQMVTTEWVCRDKFYRLFLKELKEKKDKNDILCNPKLGVIEINQSLIGVFFSISWLILHLLLIQIGNQFPKLPGKKIEPKGQNPNHLCYHMVQACPSVAAIPVTRRKYTKTQLNGSPIWLLSFASFLGFTVKDNSNDCESVPEHSSNRDRISKY